MVFRALDTETGQPVAVRRFFPFGADGGGLHDDEQSAYNRALERLAGLRHPALRSVICGGCDPVDGMPYIATEWIEGELLQRFIDQDLLVLEVAIELIDQALAVCELLSKVLAEEAVWVETEPTTIIFGSESSGRRFTFWISPLKWLGGHEKSSGLQSIVTLTEQIMGWQDRKVTDQEGHGLGGWLNWLRGVATTTSLHEARVTLTVMVGLANPPATKLPMARATRLPPLAIRRTSSWMMWLINISLALVALGLGGWVWMRQHDNEIAKSGTILAPEAALVEVEKPATTPAAVKPDAPAPKPEPDSAKTPAVPEKAAVSNKDVIPWNDHDLLVRNKGKEVVVEGVLEGIGYSDTRKNLYLLFSKEPGNNDARGSVVINTAPADLSAAALTPLIGKKIRLSGKVEIIKIARILRPDIKIRDRASILVIE